MYMLVEREDFESLSVMVDTIIRDNAIDTIYYDKDEVKPECVLRIKLVKEPDVFCAMLGSGNENCLYICSSASNKHNPILKADEEVICIGR